MIWRRSNLYIKPHTVESPECIYNNAAYNYTVECFSTYLGEQELLGIVVVVYI